MSLFSKLASLFSKNDEKYHKKKLTPEEIKQKELKKEQFRKQELERTNKYRKSDAEISSIVNKILQFDMNVDYTYPVLHYIDDEYFEKRIDDYEDKKSDLEEDILSFDNPKNFEKNISKMNKHLLEFKRFCYKNGEKDYYDNTYNDELKNWANDVKYYLENEYQFVVDRYLKKQTELKQQKEYELHIENIILNALKSNEYLRETAYVNSFTDKQERLCVKKKIKELIDKNIIIRTKKGNAYIIKKAM